MPVQILINVVLALLWMFMNSNFTVTGFFVGYTLGIVVVFIMRRFLPGRFYMKRVYAILKLTIIFLVELIKSNFSVLRIVLSPKIDIHPGFFAYPTDLEDDWEIALLSALITLTPGTVIVAISDDQRTMYIHALDLEEADTEIEKIKQNFEAVIEEVKLS